MGTIRYALRVRGRSSDAAMAALQEDLDVAIVPTQTVLRGWLPDQAALLGVLARARLLGLELVEVRRQPEWTDEEILKPDALHPGDRPTGF
jgi:hypothetical protein